MERSLLPELSPLAASALAVGLAYLKLGQFRYRESIPNTIRAVSREALRAIRDEERSAKELYGNTEYYTQLDALAGWSEPRSIFKRIKTYSFGWLRTYGILYGFPLDRILVWFFVITATFLFVIGRAHAAEIPYFFQLGRGDWISITALWWFLVASLAIPVCLSVFGELTVRRIRQRIQHNVTELRKYIENRTSQSEMKAEN